MSDFKDKKSDFDKTKATYIPMTFVGLMEFFCYNTNRDNLNNCIMKDLCYIENKKALSGKMSKCK